MKIKSIKPATIQHDGFLQKRFPDHFAQISVDTTLKLRSSVKDVARVLHDGRVPEDIEGFTRQFMNGPQGITDADFVFGYHGSEEWVEGSITYDPALMAYVKRYPKEWEIVQKVLGLCRSKSRHASAYAITNEPISNFIPTTSVSGVTVTQFTAPSVEAAGGIKMDFLVINALNDIADAIKLVQQSADWTPHDMVIDGKLVLAHEIVPFKGKFYSIWELPEDQPVFRDICEGKTETVFQFSTPGAVGWLRHFDHIKEIRPDKTVVKALNSIESLASFTALDRPGPLDYYLRDEKGEPLHNMLVEYSIRARGGKATGAMPILDQLLPETHGVIVFQEQIQKVFQIVGKTTAEQGDDFRVHTSKKQMAKVIEDKKIFMPGAIETLGEKAANDLWESMFTFSQYSFNLSHSTAYVIISYACAFLKHHFPLEWWTAVLRYADKEEVNTKLWSHCGHLIDLPDVALSGDQFEIQNGRIRAPLNLLHGIGDTAHRQLVDYKPYANLDDFCDKIQLHKKLNSTMVEKMVKIKVPIMEKNKKVGTEIREELQMVAKPGHSALNKTVVSTLIISGAMDSLFPPETSVIDALTAYNAALAESIVRATGKKKRPDRVDEKYLNVNAFVKYQMKKAVLPAYNEPLIDILFRSKHPRLTLPDSSDPKGYFEFEDGEVPIYNREDFEILCSRSPWPKHLTATAALVGYVVEARKFTYAEGKSRSAMELVLEVNGGHIKAVKWGGKDGVLPAKFRDPTALPGSIVVAGYVKYKEDKPAVLEDLEIIQASLDYASEQSPDPEESPSAITEAQGDVDEQT